MKKTRSLFRRFLLGHFLFIFIPIIVLIFLFSFIDFSGTNEEHLYALKLFYIVLLLFGFLIVAFVVLSWIFFMRLRKRITRLQQIMSSSANDGSLPKRITVQKVRMDEIDQLGTSFNRMIQQLEESRQREHEEELLRRQLIANISHDLRTPLTILRAHITRLNHESLSIEGQDSLKEMNDTITRVGDLMDDLLSYTLLTSGKHPFHPTPTDIVRFIRSSVAAWYAAFEEKEIQLDIKLPADETYYWEVDPKWMTRVIDNLFQNIIRHASDGKYASIVVDVENERIIVADKGPGMDQSSYEGGAGLGLSISKFMLKKMNLHADFISTDKGTSVVIGRA